LPGL
jgi:hypothetical protein